MTGLNFLKLMQKNSSYCDYYFTELSIDFDRFRELWLSSLSKRRLTPALFLFLEEFVDYLSYKIFSHESLSYLDSICRMLSPNRKEAEKMISNWQQDLDAIKSEIIFIIATRIFSIKKIPHRASSKGAFYYFTKDLKYHIVKNILAKKEFINPSVDFFETYTHEKPLELHLTPWEKYLFKLYSEGYTTTEITKLTGLSRQTIYIEEKKLCHYLKKKQLKI